MRILQRSSTTNTSTELTGASALRSNGRNGQSELPPSLGAAEGDTTGSSDETAEADCSLPSDETAEADCSLPGCRRPLLVGASETAIVHLGDPRAGCSVVLNPKLCLICMSQPRQIAFLPCGHFACCSACAERVLVADARAQCPLCRRPITRADGARLAQTLNFRASP